MFDWIFAPVPLAIIGVVMTFVLIMFIYARNYVKVPPHMVGVFTGRGMPKTVRGGARFRMPIIERVDFMSLEPFQIDIKLEKAYSKNGVPVSVDAVGMVRFGSKEEQLQTAVQRFLETDRNTIKDQLQQNLSGNLRGIVAKMTVEELNGEREKLASSVIEEAVSALDKLGMELDGFTIQNMNDHNGYLDALGRRRIAEVKKDAEIGEAEAKRDAAIKSAEARQAGEVALAAADTAIAQANADRDRQLAQLQAEVSAEQARSAQAGPLADAEAKKAVGVAEEEAQAARVQARTEVERRRTEQEQQRLQADVIAPAEADKIASISRAEANKATQIAEAQAQAEARTLQGRADADARTALAQAAKAEALAEAEGQTALAEALNRLTEEAARQRVLPDLIKVLPQIAQAVATPLGQIDRMVVIDNSGSGTGGAGEGGDTISRIAGAVPVTIAAVMETIKATTGQDVTGLIKAVPTLEQGLQAAAGSTVTEGGKVLGGFFGPHPPLHNNS